MCYAKIISFSNSTVCLAYRLSLGHCVHSRRHPGFLDGESSLSSRTENVPDVNSQRALLRNLLGRLPDTPARVRATTVSVRELDGYVLEQLELDLNGIEAVPAYFARPKGRQQRRPAVLFNHSHGGDYSVGKEEFIKGNRYLHAVPYARDITEQGWCGLCIDAWVFGDRSHNPEEDTFKEMLWQGKSLWGMMVYDAIRSIDYLHDRPDVDSSRIATLGMSMGSTMAWWLGALDVRVKVVVDICCLTDFHTLLESKLLSRHGLYYYVPDLLNHFTTAQINSLIAPRPHLSIAGTRDCLTPAEGLDAIDDSLRSVYSSHGAPDNWLLKRYDVGHEETAEARACALSFLQKHL